jgi:hypothetical protein
MRDSDSRDIEDKGGHIFFVRRSLTIDQSGESKYGS